MMPEDQLVYSCIQSQRVNVRKQAIQKVSAKTSPLSLVKVISRDQVLLSLIENSDSHDTLRRILVLAVSQSA